MTRDAQGWQGYPEQDWATRTDGDSGGGNGMLRSTGMLWGRRALVGHNQVTTELGGGGIEGGCRWGHSLCWLMSIRMEMRLR